MHVHLASKWEKTHQERPTHLPSTVFALVTALAACSGGASSESPDKDESSSGASGVSGGSTASSFGLPPILPPHSTSSSSGGVTGTVSATGTGGTTVSSGDTGTVATATSSMTSVASTTTSSAPPGDAGVPPLATITLGECPGNIITVPVTIGGSQTFNVVLDTGSSTLAVAGSSCTACRVTPEYTPGSTATDAHQTAQQYYGTDQQNSSGWSGEIYTDSVVLGDELGTPMKFVDISEEQNFFLSSGCTSPNPAPWTSTTQGILGIGPPYTVTPGTNDYFNQLDSTWGVMNVFAFELCGRGGTMWIGGYNQASATGPVQYTPLLQAGSDYGSYTAYLASVEVNGTTVQVASTSPDYPGSILDTGTPEWVLPPSVVTALANAIGSSPGWSQVFGSTAPSSFFTGSGFDTCLPITQTKAELDAMLPPMTLVFGQDQTISVQAAPTDSYLTFVEEQWCSTLVSQDLSGEGEVSIIGAPVLQSNIVIIDRANQQVGFAPHASGACN